jgi:hypothetical protein
LRFGGPHELCPNLEEGGLDLEGAPAANFLDLLAKLDKVLIFEDVHTIGKEVDQSNHH